MRPFTSCRSSYRALINLALCFPLAFLVACDETTNNFTGPTEPSFDPVSITLAGGCRGGSSVVCADSSTTVPASRIRVVTFVVRRANGDTVATITIPNGCATAAQLVACEIEFAGLASGTYSVLHSVTPDNDGQPATAIYRDLVVDS